MTSPTRADVLCPCCGSSDTSSWWEWSTCETCRCKWKQECHTAAASERDGYVLVPVEPTEAMTEAGRIANIKLGWGEIRGRTTDTIYRAMIAAAPSAPVDEQTEREAFEKWASPYFDLSRYGPSSEYIDHTTNSMWVGWQAARAQRKGEK